MPSTTQNETSWKNDIQELTHQDKQSSKLLTRLQALEDLYHDQPTRFADVLTQVMDLLKKGVSDDYLSLMLHQREALYEHTSPHDTAWLNDVSNAFEAFLTWFKQTNKEHEKKQWINWFETLKDSYQAELLFKQLSENKLFAIEDLKFMDLVTQLDSSRQRVLRGSAEQLSIKINCLQHLMLVAKPIQNLIWPTLLTQIAREASFKSIDLLLHQLSGSSLILKPVQEQLLLSWWNFGVNQKPSQETLSLLLDMIVTHQRLVDTGSSQLVCDLLANIIYDCIDLDADSYALKSALDCFNQLQSLDSSWGAHCFNYANTKRNYLQPAWNTHFMNAMLAGSQFGPHLSEAAAFSYLDILINSDTKNNVSHVIKKIANLGIILALPLNDLIINASKFSQPNDYFDSLFELHKALSQCTNRQQNVFRDHLFDQEQLDPSAIHRATQFLLILPELNDLLTHEQESMIHAYDLWFKKPYCSPLEFKEKLTFSNQLAPLLTTDYPDDLDDMVAASHEERRLILDVVLPKIRDADTLVHLWGKIKQNSHLKSPAYLHEVVQLQKDLETWDTEDFKSLLHFDDDELRLKRQRVMHALYNEEVHLSQHKTTSWWSHYFKAFTSWLSSGLGIKIELDKSHHLKAASSFKRVVQAIDELSRIQTKDYSNYQAPALISQGLKDQFNSYYSSYRASWWRSFDRRKLADKTLFDIGNRGSATYDQAFDAIATLLNDVVNSDKTHQKRNKKGFSRLYDIAVHLLAQTLADAMAHESNRSEEHKSRVRSIVEQHKQLVGTVDLETPAFAHLQEMTDVLNRPMFRPE